MMESQEERRKRQEGISNKIQSNRDPSQASFKMEPRGQYRVDNEDEFRKMPYEGKSKYDNEMKALSNLKNEIPEVHQKPKKFFYEHYATDLPYEPVIANNQNPSGRPPNIPPEMYEGIVVKAKRPWVHLGTENLPPVCYEEINEASFRTATKKNIPDEKKKAETKIRKKNPNKESKDSGDEEQFGMSDELDMDDGESIFNSRFDGDSKYSKSRMSKRSGVKNSENFEDEDEFVSDCTETKKRGVSLFQDGDDDEDDGFSELDDENGKSQSKSKQATKKDSKNRKRVVEDDSD